MEIGEKGFALFYEFNLRDAGNISAYIKKIRGNFSMYPHC
jgi:hypothetical protein